MKYSRGFTLLEVLVALAVIAFALASLVKVAGLGAANAAYLRDKTFAHWVAQNRLAEMKTKENLWPAIGAKEGEVAMAGREWIWVTRVKNTPDPDMRRIDIEVRLEDDDLAPVTVLTGFIARPARGSPQPGLN